MDAPRHAIPDLGLLPNVHASSRLALYEALVVDLGCMGSNASGRANNHAGVIDREDEIRSMAEDPSCFIRSRRWMPRLYGWPGGYLHASSPKVPGGIPDRTDNDLDRQDVKIAGRKEREELREVGVMVIMIISSLEGLGRRTGSYE